MGHCAILMHSMLSFTMHLGHYRCHEKHYIKEYKRKGIPLLTPLPAIDVVALLMDSEENLMLEQIRGTHPGILDLLGDPGNPLYAEPLSMTEHFDTMIVGARHLGDLPKHGHCKDMQITAWVYKDDSRLFGHERTGRESGRADVSTHANPNPHTQTLRAALL